MTNNTDGKLVEAVKGLPEDGDAGVWVHREAALDLIRTHEAEQQEKLVKVREALLQQKKNLTYLKEYWGGVEAMTEEALTLLDSMITDRGK